MAFLQILNELFPGVVLEEKFVAETRRVLGERGFSAENTIACVGGCRDEITHSLNQRLESAWGDAFSFASLAGMLTLGVTGMGAAHAHAPIDEDGRERYLYVVMPHIAVGANGEIGQCTRPGRDGISSACGALVAFQKELASGTVQLEFDSADPEQSLLKQRLHPLVANRPVPDLIELTKITHDAIVNDLKTLIEQTVDPQKACYAVLSGIHIHGGDGQQYVQPIEAYAVEEGRKVELSALK